MTMTTGIPCLCGVVGSASRRPVTSGHGSTVLPRSAFAGFQGARRQKRPIGPPICAHNVGSRVLYIGPPSYMCSFCLLRFL